MNRVLIIAEAGVNHNGNIDIAYKLIDEAKKSGADIIKFQTFKTESVISKFAEKAKYQKNTTNSHESQFEMVKKLELDFEEFLKLKEYCNKMDIEFLSTPFDFGSIDFLNNLGISFWKIPSGEITNLPYLEKIGETKKSVIMSTGMANMNEIEKAIDVLKSKGTDDISILHCNTEYPTPFEDVNLKAMNSIKERFNCKVGYSDHTKGIEVPIAAVAMGAKVIEKHFTLDRNMEGPDHRASLEPDELKKMVDSIRNIEKALGDGIKEPSKSEIKNIEIARKSIVALKNIKKGDVFTEENITTKRPGSGISPMKWYEVLGKKATKDFYEDELIEL